MYVCPNCGYCPHCGRGGYVRPRPVPYVPYVGPYVGPFWPNVSGAIGRARQAVELR